MYKYLAKTILLRVLPIVLKYAVILFVGIYVAKLFCIDVLEPYVKDSRAVIFLVITFALTYFVSRTLWKRIQSIFMVESAIHRDDRTPNDVPNALAHLAITSQYDSRYADWVVSKAMPKTKNSELIAYARSHRLDYAKLKLQPDVAGHEAAHAVVSHLLGATVISMQDGLFHGEMISHDPTFSMWNKLMILVAGDAWNIKNDTARGADRDFNSAMSVISHIIMNGERPYWYSGTINYSSILGAAHERVRKMLDEHVELVELVRGEIHQNGRMNGQQFNVILETYRAERQNDTLEA